jgi:hypothetical protein
MTLHFTFLTRREHKENICAPESRIAAACTRATTVRLRVGSAMIYYVALPFTPYAGAGLVPGPSEAVALPRAEQIVQFPVPLFGRYKFYEDVQGNEPLSVIASPRSKTRRPFMLLS